MRSFRVFIFVVFFSAFSSSRAIGQFSPKVLAAHYRELDGRFLREASTQPSRMRDFALDFLGERKLLPADPARADLVIKRYLEFHEKYSNFVLSGQIDDHQFFKTFSEDSNFPGMSERGTAAMIAYADGGDVAFAIAAIHLKGECLDTFSAIEDHNFSQIFGILLADGASDLIQRRLRTDGLYLKKSGSAEVIGRNYIRLMQVCVKQGLNREAVAELIDYYRPLREAGVSLPDVLHLALEVSATLGNQQRSEVIAAMLSQGLGSELMLECKLNPKLAPIVANDLADYHDKLKEQLDLVSVELGKLSSGNKTGDVDNVTRP